MGLFAVMNGQEWDRVTPLLELLPWMKPFFVTFTIYSSWALLSVMTGVVSDHIQYVREVHDEHDEEANMEEKETRKRELLEIFAAANKDGSGNLPRNAVYLQVFSNPFQ